MGTPKRFLLILPLAALALAGCGGGGGDESTAAAPVETTEATTALSKEELISQGDAICAEVNAAVGTVGSTSSGASGEATQVASLYNGMAERLKNLGAPSDDSSGYPEFISAAEQLAQAESNVSLAAGRGEEEALTSAEAEASAVLSSFQSAALSFGFEDCAEAPSAPTPSSAGGEPAEEESSEGVEEAAPEAEEEVEAAPEAAPVEEESAGGGATAGGGTEGGGSGSGGGSSGGIGPG
ncbi:MAG TPA: hypothetical protein VLK89_09580 [Solirubrobacterales bacterium]|nr:hypothetical protein [Solirubrobacterales bacterium]